MTDHGADGARARGGEGGGRARNGRLAAWLSLVMASMLALSFASVPLYRLFCEATGYDGTPRRAAQSSARTVDRTITVKFDANTSAALNWNFHPVQRQVVLKVGENSLAFFRAENRAAHPLTGTATFSVTPEIAASYFTKVQCFCFTEQTLAPGEAIDMPVSFFVDPAFADDPDTKHLSEITLSYTFFNTAKPVPSAIAAPRLGRPLAAPDTAENGGHKG